VGHCVNYYVPLRLMGRPGKSVAGVTKRAHQFQERSGTAPPRAKPSEPEKPDSLGAWVRFERLPSRTEDPGAGKRGATYTTSSSAPESAARPRLWANAGLSADAFGNRAKPVPAAGACKAPSAIPGTRIPDRHARSC